MARNERRARGRSPIPGESAGGRADAGIGSAVWRKHGQASVLRDLEGIRPVAKKYPLDWDDETSVLIQSALHGLSNCVVPKKDARLLSSSRAATASASVVLGFHHASTGFSAHSPRRGVRFAANLITRHDGEGAADGESSGGQGSSRGPSDLSSSSDVDFQSSPVYIRPAIRRGIQPYDKAKTSNSIGNAISSFVKHSFSHEDEWTTLEDYEQEQSRHSILSDSISIISGADTVLAGFKTPEVSAHGYDCSLHGHQAALTKSKSVEELRAELMAMVHEVEEAGHIRIVSGDLPTYNGAKSAKGRGLFGWVRRRLARLQTSCLRPTTA